MTKIQKFPSKAGEEEGDGGPYRNVASSGFEAETSTGHVRYGGGEGLGGEGGYEFVNFQQKNKMEHQLSRASQESQSSGNK